MSNTYYWEFGFDFNKGTITPGLAQLIKGTVQNITNQCEQVAGLLTWTFNKGDQIYFTIFDVTGSGQQSNLVSASINFKNPFGWDVSIPFPDQQAKQTQSITLGGVYPSWVYPLTSMVVYDGTFDFMATMQVSQGSNTKVISLDPEMIVQAPTGG